MRKNAMLINTARQEVVNEDDIARIMAERSDISFVSDFMPKSDKLLDESMRKRWFVPVKKWAPKRKKQMSMPVSRQQSRSFVSLIQVTEHFS